MTRLLQLLMKLLGTAFVVVCAATVTTQAIGVGMFWKHGGLSADKLVRYAGVIYGLDPLDLAPPTEKMGEPKEPKSRAEILEDRVQKTPRLIARQSAIRQGTDDIRGVTLSLKWSREKHVTARDGFASYLKQVEEETAVAALRELRATLESLAPKQTKDILRTTLTTPPVDAMDQPMRDVVALLTALPEDKLRKILGEFKTEDERKLLHQILVEIGKLDQRTAQATATPGGSP